MQLGNGGGESDYLDSFEEIPIPTSEFNIKRHSRFRQTPRPVARGFCQQQKAAGYFYYDGIVIC
jgi:hypothetical protein